jgi:hypothetical protein
MLGIVLAWIKFLEKEFRAKAVKVDGKCVVVFVTCENCRLKGSERTKKCLNGRSQGCGEFIYKGQS